MEPLELMKKDSDLDETKRLMGALIRQPPKLHEDMKVGKAKPKKDEKASPQKRRRAPKPAPA